MDSENLYTITGGPLKPHEWIRVKRVMTAADEAWIQNHSIAPVSNKKDAQIQMTIGEVRLATLKRMIVDWYLTRKVVATNGAVSQTPIQLSEQAIENLPVKISNYVHEVLNRLDDEEEGESDADFLPAADGHSTASLSLVKSTLENG